jgi:hypothetical protein
MASSEIKRAVLSEGRRTAAGQFVASCRALRVDWQLSLLAQSAWDAVGRPGAPQLATLDGCGLPAFVLKVIRTNKEEKKLIEKFGDQYRSDMATTGKFWPKMSLRKR